MIKQLEPIKELYEQDERVLKTLMLKNPTNKMVYKAILELKQEEISDGFHDHQCYHYIAGIRLLNEAIEQNNLDAIRLKIYVSEGHTVCEHPEFSSVEALYKKLYTLTQDEEILLILDNIQEYLRECRINHCDELYDLRCDLINERTDQITSSVDPDVYYENLKKDSD